MIWNLIRSIYGRSSIEIAHFVLIHLQTWLPQAIIALDWSISKNLLWNCNAKMNRNLVGSTYGRFCIKFPQSRMKGERHRLSLPFIMQAMLRNELKWLTLWKYDIVYLNRGKKRVKIKKKKTKKNENCWIKFINSAVKIKHYTNI
jgi:hypothetical protein